jgi:predicted GIY-YIG superfamily endonuclease
MFNVVARSGTEWSDEAIQSLYTKAMSDKQPCVYILASDRNGTLYTGVTSNLGKRIDEHKRGFDGFTSK